MSCNAFALLHPSPVYLYSTDLELLTQPRPLSSDVRKRTNSFDALPEINVEATRVTGDTEKSALILTQSMSEGRC